MDLEEALIEKYYQEALKLLDEGRDYLEWQAPIDLNSLSATDNLYLTREVARLTARITEILAWLIVQKVILNGRFQPITKIELGDQTHCKQDSREACPIPIPPELLDLLDRSLKMYERVERLEENLKLKIETDRPQ